MRKSTSLLKRLVSLFLVVLISINTYAAIVGDNDGAAFVTKAEFDSLRNTFDAQINQYNSSIDNKIDGAIGSYLAGVKTNDKPYIMLNDIKGSVGRDLRFQNNIVNGISSNTTRYLATKQKTYSFSYSDKSKSGFKFSDDQTGEIYAQTKNGWVYGLYGQRSDTKQTYNWEKVTFKNEVVDEYDTNDYSRWSYFGVLCCDIVLEKKLSDSQLASGAFKVNFYRYSPYNEEMVGNKDYVNATYTMAINKTQQDFAQDFSTSRYWIEIKYDEVAASAAALGNKLLGINIHVPSYNVGEKQITSSSSAPVKLGWVRPATTVKQHYVLSNQWSQVGSGNAWFKIDLANNNKFLLGYRACYPLAIINYSSQWFKEFGEVELSDNVFDYTTAHSLTISPPSSWEYKTDGTKYTAYTETDNINWYEVMLNFYQGQLNYTNIQTDQFSGNAFANNLWFFDLHIQPQITGNISSNLTWDNSIHAMEGYNHEIGKANVTATGVKLTPTGANLRTFEQLYLTGLAGEVVWMGGGAPLMRMRAEQSTEYTVKMDLLSRNSSGTAANSTVTVRLSYKQFKDGNFNATTDKIYEANVSCNSSGKGTATFDITGIPKDSIVWYSLLSTTNRYTAECTNCTVTIK